MRLACVHISLKEKFVAIIFYNIAQKKITYGVIFPFFLKLGLD